MEKGESGHPRHPEITEDDIERFLRRENREGLGGARRGDYLVLILELPVQRLAHDFLVVHTQHARQPLTRRMRHRVDRLVVGRAAEHEIVEHDTQSMEWLKSHGLEFRLE